MHQTEPPFPGGFHRKTADWVLRGEFRTGVAALCKRVIGLLACERMQGEGRLGEAGPCLLMRSTRPCQPLRSRGPTQTSDQQIYGQSHPSRIDCRAGCTRSCMRRGPHPYALASRAYAWRYRTSAPVRSLVHRSKERGRCRWADPSRRKWWPSGRHSHLWTTGFTPSWFLLAARTSRLRDVAQMPGPRIRRTQSARNRLPLAPSRSFCPAGPT